MPRNDPSAPVRFVKHPITGKVRTAQVLDPEDDGSPDFDHLEVSQPSASDTKRKTA